MVFQVLVPKIEETYYTAKQLAIPRLLQFQVDIAGAAAKHMEDVEKVVGSPFVYLRFYITLANSHFWRNRIAHLGQLVSHCLLTFNQARIHNVGTVKLCYRVREVHILSLSASIL